MCAHDRVYNYDIPAFRDCEELKHLASVEATSVELVEEVVSAALSAKGDGVMNVIDAVLTCLDTAGDMSIRRTCLDMLFNLARNGFAEEMLELQAVVSVVRVGRVEMRFHSVVVLCCLNVLRPLAACTSNATKSRFAMQEGVVFVEEAERFYNKSVTFKKVVKAIRQEVAKHTVLCASQAKRAERVAAQLLQEEEDAARRRSDQLKKRKTSHKKRVLDHVASPAAHPDAEPESDAQTEATLESEPAFYVNDEQDLVLSCVLHVLEDRSVLFDCMKDFLSVS